MSQPKVVGSVVAVGTTVAALPVTGQPIAALALAGLGLIVAGGLLMRLTRVRRESN
jgi:LPXTG-motif cell wall-anchored protein